MSTFKPSAATNAEWLASMKAGKITLGCAVNSSSNLVAELVATQGYDFVLLDAQHSAINPENLRSLIQAVHAGGSKTMIRVGSAYDRIGIQYAFDLGSDAILVPCSRTAEDVKHAVSCAKYPVNGPGSDGGSRSVYLNLRPQFPGGFGSLFDYVSTSGNASTIVAAQIETKDAYENIDEICAVPGLDIAFIGPGDLAVDMGLAKEVGMPACWGDPRFVEAETKIGAACKKASTICRASVVVLLLLLHLRAFLLWAGGHRRRLLELVHRGEERPRLQLLRRRRRRARHAGQALREPRHAPRGRGQGDGGQGVSRRRSRRGAPPRVLAGFVLLWGFV